MVGGGLSFLLLLNVGIDFWVLRRLERKAQAPIRGVLIPHFFLPSFSLLNPSLDWRGRFQILSGKISVQYDPLFTLRNQKLRTRVTGQNLTVRFSHELALTGGLSEAKVERAEADFAFSREGPPEIFLLEVRSPQINFHLARNSFGSPVKTRAQETVN